MEILGIISYEMGWHAGESGEIHGSARFERISDDLPSDKLLGVRDLRRKINVEACCSATGAVGSHYSWPYVHTQGTSLEWCHAGLSSSRKFRNRIIWIDHLWLQSGIIGRVFDIF